MPIVPPGLSARGCARGDLARNSPPSSACCQLPSADWPNWPREIVAVHLPRLTSEVGERRGGRARG